MLKKLLILLLLGIISASAYLYWDYSKKRTVITPYPYAFLNSFDDKYNKEHAQEITQAENAKILILGDRMGKTLDAYADNIKGQFGDAVKTPPSIYNWSAENEGLFRSIHKLKKLKKFPPIVIYFGGTSELFEKKFEIKDKKRILKNFKTFDDEKLISLIITFPWLSKALYQNISYQDLGDFKEYKSNLAASEKLEEKELTYKLYEYEVNELISLVKDKKSSLIFITAPLNLNVEPKEVCAHSETEDTIGMQQEIEAEIKEGAFKSAYPKALELSEVTYSNARSFYLLGQAALGQGNIQTARTALMKATAFDCSNWRGSAVYNAIIKAYAEKNQVTVIDFDQYLASNISEEGLFQDEIFPQNVFYQNMIKELGDILKKILSVNE